MSRPIKFRAWDGDEMFALREWDFIHGSCEIKLTKSGTQCNVVDEVDLEIMQYTGLLDKNGVEIYEGDIINYEDEFIEVKPPRWGGVDAFTVYGYQELVSFYDIYESDNPLYGKEPSRQVTYGEVIGNIYENSELLEDKE